MRIIQSINMKKQQILKGIFAGLVLVFTISCERKEEELKPATYPDTAEVFIDSFSAGLEYAAFGDSKLTAFTVDDNVSYEGVIGTSSMRFDIPNEGDPQGSYAGGIFRDPGGRDLTGYDALTFYAKASRGGTVDLLGFGVDFGENKYATSANITLSTAWTKYTIPIPDPSRLTREEGLFVVAEGPEDGEGYTIWFDVVKYEKLGTLAHPRPAILNGEDVAQQTFIGVSANITGLTQTFNLANGTNQTVNVAPSYFEFTSSDTTVAKVDELGLVSVVGEGTAKITGTLDGVEAAGSLTLESLGEFQQAPIPDRDAADVISIFSDAYDNVPVDFYNGYFAPFQTTLGQDDINIDGDNIIKYTQLNFVATEFKNPTVNASEMTHFHVDIQIENPIEAGDFVKIELRDFGADDTFDGGDDAVGQYIINTAPPLTSNQWISLDISLSEIGLSQRGNMAQILFVTDGTASALPGTITDMLVDNMYFYKDDTGGGGPCTPDLAQSLSAADFDMTFETDPSSIITSDGGAYSYIDNPDADNAVNPSCKVGQIVRDAGLQFANTQFDFDAKFDFNANAGFKLKVWSATAGTDVLVKLEDKASSGSVFTEVAGVTTLAGEWEELTFDFAATESGKYDKIVLFFELGEFVTGTYYIDDFKLYSSGGGATCDPETGQSLSAADFDVTFQTDPTSIITSDGGAYSYIDNPDADNAVNTSCKVGQIDRDPGLQFANTQFDLDAKFDFNANAGFKLKVWSPTAGTDVLVKLEDKTNSSVFAEVSAVTTSASAWEELTFDFASGESGKYDKIVLFFELGEFIAETYYIDDFRLYGSGGGGGSSAPTDAPATPPTRDPADVISIYGEAYGTAVGLNNVPWDGATEFVEENIASNNVLKVNFDGFMGSELGSVVDASAMTHFHMDFWIADDFSAGQIFNPKWSNHAGGAGETSSFELTRAIGADDVKKWVSIDVPITDFTTGDNTQRAELAQYLISVAGLIDVAYIDNIYFYKDSGGGGGASAPTDAPPTPPTRDPADVISIYGEAYGTAVGLNNVPWDGATEFVEENIASNNVLKVNFDGFMGSELGSVVDASAMTHFHMDFWIADDFSAGQIFNPKWSNHAGGAGETSSFELTRAIGADDVKKWVSIDVPITDFTTGDNTQRAELAQYLISVAGLIDVAYIDNIYFYKDTGGGGGGAAAPTDAPPTPPTRDPADVISIYGEAYGAAVGLNNVPWDGATEFVEENIASNNVLKVNFDGFMGSDLGSVTDASAMTHFHMDFWISDDFAAGQIFNPKWSNHAGGSGETSAFEYTRAIGGGDVQTWVSIDIPITDFATGDNTQRAELAQFLISVAGLIDIAYVDNIYFYK